MNGFNTWRQTQNRRRAIARGGATILTNSIPAFRSQAATTPPRLETAHSQFVILEPAEDVSAVKLLRPDGREVAIGSYRGKALLIAFWASWCPPCRRELPILERLQSRRGAEPFEVAAVSLDRDPATALRFMREIGLKNFSTFVDPRGIVASTPESQTRAPFRLWGMPMSYVIDKNGRNAGYLTGEADWGSAAATGLLRYFGES